MDSTKIILLCSGKGLRAGFSNPKQFVFLDGKPIIYYLLNTAMNCNFKNEVYLVILIEYQKTINNILQKYFSEEQISKIKIVFGDSSRQKSIQNAYEYLKKTSINEQESIVVIDGVRPLITTNLLEEMYNINQNKYDVVGCYTDCVSTILEKDGDLMSKSLVRSTLAESHTPQFFKYYIFKKMYQNINEFDLKNETECLNIALKYAHKRSFLHKTEHSQVMKITYQNDLQIAENILKNKIKKVILVTGGSKGIGNKISLRLSDLGHKVIICSRNNSDLSKISSSCQLDTFKCDISNRQEVLKMFSFILRKYGKLDILINNASISHDTLNIEDLDENTIEKVLNINIKGSLWCLQEALKIMKQQQSGKIITIGSSGIKNGREGQSVYLCTKNALKTLSECTALEAKKNNIYTYYVAPRRTNTSMRRKMYPKEDISSLLDIDDLVSNIMFLITDNIPNLTGSSFWIK